MKSIAHFLSKEKSLAWIIAIAAVVRLLFVFIGGRFYYGTPDYFIHGDTTSWFQAFINLIDHGTFTVNPKVDAAKFFRPPGYSFLFGIFYLITLKNYVLAWKLLVAVQVIMDVASVYLIAGISKSIVQNQVEAKRNFFSNLSALLYAVYPMAIVVAPLLHAETASIFFILLSLRFAFRRVSIRNAFFSGVFAGFAALIRLQCAFLIPFLMMVFVFGHADKILASVKHALVFCFAIGITYGLWPARNFLLHDRLIFSQDIHVGGHWSEDFISFLDFTHSISTDHTPYYWAILKNEKVNWPPSAYIDPGDSLLLDSVVMMCRTCSNGFAYWKAGERLVPKLELPAKPCEAEIAVIFNELTEKQKTRNGFHYWITIPLHNLAKCFFKLTLYGNKPFMIKAFSSLLFVIRSLLVVSGLAGIFLAFKKQMINRKFLFVVFGYVMAWYLFISFIHRNIEIRYLIQTDTVLLIPAAFAIMVVFFNKYLKGYE